MQTSVFIGKKQQLRIPKYNAKYNECHQYNPPHNYTDTLNRSAFLSKYRKHQTSSPLDSKKDAHKKSWCQIPHLIFQKCFNQT